MARPGTSRVAESRQSVWVVPASPAIWGVHFLASYITAALWCGMVADRIGPLSSARVAIAAYTVIALAAIGLIGWRGYRAHTFEGGEPPHDADSPEDRHRFIGYATLLLSGLSAVAVIYSAMAAVFIETCQ